MEMISCVSFSSSIPNRIGIGRPNNNNNNIARSLGFSSSLCSSPKLLNCSARVTTVAVRGNRRRNKGLTCNALFGLGVPELAVIAGVAALVFGPKQLPEVGRSLGKTIKGFQKAAKEFESELKKEPDSIEGGSSEKPLAASDQEKQDIEVSSSKETV